MSTEDGMYSVESANMVEPENLPMAFDVLNADANDFDRFLLKVTAEAFGLSPEEVGLGLLEKGMKRIPIKIGPPGTIKAVNADGTIAATITNIQTEQ